MMDDSFLVRTEHAPVLWRDRSCTREDFTDAGSALRRKSLLQLSSFYVNLELEIQGPF